jgi:hypothetical protein
MLAHFLLLAGGDVADLTESAQAFGALLGKNMALVGLAVHDFCRISSG